MAESMAFSRDVGRNQLPGLNLPTMQIELGEPNVYLRNEDFKCVEFSLDLPSTSTDAISM